MGEEDINVPALKGKNASWDESPRKRAAPMFQDPPSMGV